MIIDVCTYVVRTYTSFACMMQNAGSCRVASREAGGGLVLAATTLRTPKWGGAAAAALSLPHVCPPQPLLAHAKSGTVIITLYLHVLLYISTSLSIVNINLISQLSSHSVQTYIETERLYCTVLSSY